MSHATQTIPSKLIYQITKSRYHHQIHQYIPVAKMSRLDTDAGGKSKEQIIKSFKQQPEFAVPQDVPKPKARFVENEVSSDLYDPLEYPRNGKDPGLVVIFNFETFDNGLKERKGTEWDVLELRVTLSRLKYNVDRDLIFTDLTRGELKKEIKNICAMEERLKDANCLICIFLSHGGENNTLYTKDAQIDVKEVYEDFAKCEHLKKKPKLFIFQACKLNVKPTDDHTDSKGKDDKTARIVSEETIVNHIPEDLLLAYSTLEGEVSIRDTLHGTWFIQELCRNFNAYGRRDDVISMIIRTTKCLAHTYCADLNMKQLPVFVSTLRKKFFLTRSKDRLQILEMSKEIKNIHREMAEMKKMMDQLLKESS